MGESIAIKVENHLILLCSVTKLESLMPLQTKSVFFSLIELKSNFDCSPSPCHTIISMSLVRIDLDFSNFENLQNDIFARQQIQHWSLSIFLRRKCELMSIFHENVCG